MPDASRNALCALAVGVLAAAVATVGDGLLLRVANALALGAPAEPSALLAGHYLGTVTIPLYALGYWAISRALAPGAPGLSSVIFLSGAYAAALGGAIHGITTLVIELRGVEAGDGAGPLETVVRYGRFLLPLWGLAGVLVVLASIAFARAVLPGRTPFPRWMAVTNPALLCVAISVLSAPSALGRAYLLPAAPNVSHVLWFALALPFVARLRDAGSRTCIPRDP